MILSMTAYTYVEQQGEWGTLRCDIRSLNHRYLEVSLKLPDSMRDCETAIREAIKAHIHRGKLELSLNYQPGATVQTLNINPVIAAELQQATQSLTTVFGTALNLNPLEILRWPGLLNTVDITPDLSSAALRVVTQALAALNEVRAREGQSLCHFINARLEELEQLIYALQPYQSTLIAEQRQRLLDRIQEINVSVDAARLEQELVIFAHKTDIAEEMSRILIHTQEIKRLLAGSTPVGKKLDFLMQELHREANTLGSKASSLRTTHVAIDSKVLIEQIREQIQNLE